jgi:hypothetical protein
MVDRNHPGGEMTSPQAHALRLAQEYVGCSGFSKAGLIDQLSSPAGEGLSEAEATVVVDHLEADWNAEAVEAAEDYLDQEISKPALIEQLSSPVGERFTPAQAQYAADRVY